jgi:hypothetical protein
MRQIEKHSKIAVGLRKGGLAPEKNPKSRSHSTQESIQQLDIFAE